MSLPTAQLVRRLRAIANGNASFEDRAELEMFLADELMAKSLPDVVRMLCDLEAFEFRDASDPTPDDHRRLLANVDAGQLVVELSASDVACSANVTLETEPEAHESVPDKRHAWFYAIWEDLLASAALGDPRQLEEPRRTVALVALFEAEVMNGGLGQYLANTSGEYVEDTLACLASIGATRSRSLLTAACQLRDANESYDDLWERKSEQLGKLDDEFLAAGEDLAALVADSITGADS